MIFKLNIEENELYFSFKSNTGYFTKDAKSDVIPTKKVYSQTGKYKELYKVLNKVFNEYHFAYENVDNIDIQFTLTGQYHVLTYYGDVEVFNSKDEKHFIKGVYTKFTLNYHKIDNKYYLKHFKMFRDNYTAFELKEGYLFSHCIPNESSVIEDMIYIANTHCKFQDMCLGSSELAHITDTYKFLKNIDFTDLFLIIDSFIRWESIEGIPYCYMFNIYGNSLGINSTSNIIGYEPIILNILRQSGIKTWLDTNNNIKIEHDSLVNVCNKVIVQKNDFNRDSKKYDPSKLEYYSKLQSSSKISEVYFNDKYVVVNCKPTDVNKYEQYISTIFKHVDNNIVYTLTNHINDLLSVYKFEEEYEIVN